MAANPTDHSFYIDPREELRIALEDSQSLLVAMLRGRISSEEIEGQIIKNQDALLLASV